MKLAEIVSIFLKEDKHKHFSRKQVTEQFHVIMLKEILDKEDSIF